jgi:hypothetical protein
VRGLLRQGALWLHDDVDLFPAIRHLLRRAYRNILACLSHALLADATTPVHVHLRANNEIQRERERESSRHEGVVHLLRGGEQPCGAASDLRDDGKGGELACAARAVVLGDLRELGEEGEWDRPELRCGECARGRSEQRKADYEGGKDRSKQLSSWVGCGGERSGRGGVVEDDEKSDEHVLDGKEEVLSVGGEGEAISRGVGEAYSIRERLQDVCSKGEAPSGLGSQNWAVVRDEQSRAGECHALRSSCGTFITDPPTTTVTPIPLDNEYLMHCTSSILRFSIKDM